MWTMLFRWRSPAWRANPPKRKEQIVKLLLIEENDLMARALNRGFREEGFDVSTVDDADGAIRLARSHAFDVLVLDMRVPAQLAALFALRRARVSTPILLLTNPETPAARINAWGLGPCDILVKPFAYDILLGSLRRLAQSEPAIGA
jgi:two-component system, OmpR family, response regulator